MQLMKAKVKFRYSEKATKFEKSSRLFLKLFIKGKTKWEIFYIFVAFS